MLCHTRKAVMDDPHQLKSSSSHRPKDSKCWVTLLSHQPSDCTPQQHPAEHSARIISFVYDCHSLAYFAHIISHAFMPFFYLYTFLISSCLSFKTFTAPRDFMTFSCVLIFASLVFECY